ncbi:TetR/AcrR family transcriptional regulator [Nocardia sp. NPDC050713]|uniref:TetR/AcrR family transcriptional regulator n=1 Tax=Nocardia sp. NPDC050713 TaxID=3154511 RepID=UPI0033E5A066
MSRTYGGRPAEDRAAERRQRLIDVGIDVVGRGGVAALGMRLVCREAGLSQKFFYESFPNLEALVHAVYQAALSKMEDAVAPSISAGDVRGGFDAAARLMQSDPRLCRILLIEPFADADLRRYVRESAPGIVRGALGDFVGGTEDDPLVRMRYSALLGAQISLFVEWTEGNLGADRDAFVDHATEVAKQLVGIGIGAGR